MTLGEIMKNAEIAARGNNAVMISQIHIEIAMKIVLGDEFVSKPIVSRQDRLSAVNAVNMAVKAGKMQPATAYPCATCGIQADEHHHWSYEKSHRLLVIPLCTRCHSKVHRGEIIIDNPLSLVGTVR